MIGASSNCNDTNIGGFSCILEGILELDINSNLNLPIPVVINDELALNVSSDSGSSDDETTGGFNFINDDKSLMIYLIV